MNKRYRPSNGTEGIYFVDAWCCNCINGKYEHTGDTADNPCEILTRSFMCDIDDKNYPKEWQYDSNNKPICTAYVKWDWNRDDDGNLIDPIFPEPENPSQLCMPFIFDELEIYSNEQSMPRLE